MQPIDALLNKLTMYRLLVLTLGGYIALAILYAFMGKVSSTPTQLVVSLGLIVTSAYVADRWFARLFRWPTNMESALITALILFLILKPAHSISDALVLALAGGLSSVFKFLISWHGKHIFNPAALAAAVLSLSGLAATTWWIGSSVFWPVTLVLGLAIVRKIRRFPLVSCFVVVSIVTQVVLFLHNHQPLATSLHHFLVASPLIFLSTIMLTEPATMPARRDMQLVFAGLIAVLYVTAFSIGPLVIYPEVALLLGNLFAWAVSPKFHVRLELAEVQKISDRVYNYIFKPEHRFEFIPGQYMEWTLGDVAYDARGNRRTFTIASSPSEPEVQLGLKYYEPASMYKAAFQQLEPGDHVYASQLAGNFTIKGHEDKPLAFIAGGIGITPFRSMVKYLTDTEQEVDIVLLYVVSTPKEFVYIQELLAGKAVGIRTIPVVTDLSYKASNVVTAKLSAETIEKLIPDFDERTFYISGPNTMVDGSKQYLRLLGVPRSHIKTDHFSGY